MTASNRCWAEPIGKRVGTATTRMLLSTLAASRMAAKALGLLFSMAMMATSATSAYDMMRTPSTISAATSRIRRSSQVT